MMETHDCLLLVHMKGDYESDRLSYLNMNEVIPAMGSEIEIATNKIFGLNFQHHFSCCGRDLCSLFNFLTNMFN